MKNLYALLVAVCVCIAANAQTKYTYKYVAVSFQPQYTLHTFSAKNSLERDSLKGIQQNRTGFTIFLQYQKQMGQNLMLQTGIQYTNTGFVRVAKNLKFTSSIHPDVPLIDQTIQTTPEPTAEMNYVFDYIDIPVLFNRKIYFTSKPSKHWEFYGTYGASLNFLIQDRVAARLKGFTMDNKRAFNIKNTYLKSNFFNVTAILGLRANYNYSNKLGFLTQPLLSVPLLPATRGDYTYRLLSVGMQIGVYFNLDVDGEEEIIE